LATVVQIQILKRKVIITCRCGGLSLFQCRSRIWLFLIGALGRFVENEMKWELKQISFSTYVKTLTFLKVYENLYLGKVKGSQLFVYQGKVENTTNLNLDT